MRNFCTYFLGLLSFFSLNINAQNVDLQFIEATDNDCSSNQFCTTIQVKGNSGADYIGISSIRFDYDSAVIYFDGNQNSISQGSFTPHNFDASTVGAECPGFSPYDQIYFDGTNPGMFLLTIILSQPSIGNTIFACPNVANNWIDVGTICFDVVDASGNPNLVFIGSENGPPEESSGCIFHSDTNNPADTYDNGAFTNFTTPLDQLCASEGINMDLKVALQGALLGNADNLMRDDLRFENLLPIQEPYTALPNFNHVGNGGGEIITNDLLKNTGDMAPVDWLFLEICDANNPAIKLATQSVLVTKSHQIMTASGETNIEFPDLPSGDYYIALRHRNHFGAMTATPITFDNETIELDFTDLNFPLWGTNAQAVISNSFLALWAGNVSGDENIIFQGNNNDSTPIFFHILSDPTNSTGLISFISTAYAESDINLDGQIIYQGTGNEPTNLFFNVLTHPENSAFINNFIISEQMP